MGGSLVQLNMNLQGAVSGENTIIIPDSGAILISNMTMGQGGNELTDMALNAFAQTMSQIYGAAASSVSAKIGKPVHFGDSRPVVAHANTELTLPGGGSLVRLSYSMKIGGQNPVNVSQVMSFRLPGTWSVPPRGDGRRDGFRDGRCRGRFLRCDAPAACRARARAGGDPGGPVSRVVPDGGQHAEPAQHQHV
jgi:hypothetical protein